MNRDMAFKNSADVHATQRNPRETRDNPFPAERLLFRDDDGRAKALPIPKSSRPNWPVEIQRPGVQLVPTIQYADAPFATSASVQWRARSHGISGIHGNCGNVESVTYRI